MKALFITQHNPFGTKGGGVMASHAYLRAFSDVFNGNIDLVCADIIKGMEDHEDPQIKLSNIYYAPDRTKLQKTLTVFTGYLNRYTEFTKRLLKKNKDSYDYVIFDQNGVAGPLVGVAKKMGLKTITIHHNMEVEYFGDNTHGLYRSVFLPHVRRWEKKSYLESDINLFLTGQDMDAFERVYGKTSACNQVLGTFEYHDYIESKNTDRVMQNDKITFAITGSMGNHQTTDGVGYFFEELYDCLPDDCRIIIAGRKPSAKVREWCASHANVELIANPENMDDVIRRADVYICPTRIGGGLKLRVMDGVRNGLPVLVHSCSARGFDMFYDKDCFKIFNNEEEFKRGVSHIVGLIQDCQLAPAEVQQVYKNAFSYEAGKTRLKNILKFIDSVHES